MRSLIHPLNRTVRPTVSPNLDFLFGGLFDDAMRARAAQRVAGIRFPIDVNETDQELVLTAELPGVRADELEITVKGDVLTLAGEKRAPHATAEVAETPQAEGEAAPVQAPAGRNSFRERAYGPFRRELKLPFTVDASSVVADYTDGVLTVTLPKADSERPHRIQIGG